MTLVKLWKVRVLACDTEPEDAVFIYAPPEFLDRSVKVSNARRKVTR